MNIGEHEGEIFIEPLPNTVPMTEPMPKEQPVLVPEPEKVPA